MGTNELEILKVLYQRGGEASKATIEDSLQIELGRELVELKGQGLIHVTANAVALTRKGMKSVEANNLVPTQTIAECSQAREMVKKALRSVLEHDLTGYNLAMQEAQKTFPQRYLAAVERYYSHNLP